MKTQNISDVFPKTLQWLKKDGELKAGRLIKKFEEEKFPSTDQIDFFPRFLKAEKVSAPTIEIAHFEWIQFRVTANDLGQYKADLRGLFLNKSFHAISIGDEASAWLKLKPGIFAFWLSNGAVGTRQLDKVDEKIVDLLSEDAVFDVEGLVKFLEQDGAKNGEDIRERLNQLIRDGIVIQL